MVNKGMKLLASLGFSLMINAFLFAGMGMWITASRSPEQREKRAEVSSEIFVPQKKRPPKKIETPKKTPRMPQPLAIGLPDIPSAFSIPAFKVTDNADKIAVVHPETKALPASLMENEMILTEDVLDESPKPLIKTAPVYPARLEREGVEGEVEARLLLAKDGAVMRVEIVHSIPSGVFDDAAGRALASWKFQPATYRGKPLKAWVTQRVLFKLH